MNELVKIQTDLKAPKSQFNSFGKYYYRNCEDILEALKPLEAAFGVFVTLSDELILIGQYPAIKATATITHAESGKSVSTTAFAVVDLNKKGMDAAQATGAASSYARKYALNGLFAIDDSKDADTQHQNTPQNQPLPQKSSAQISSPKSQPNYGGHYGSPPNQPKSSPQSYPPAVELTPEQQADLSQLLETTSTDLGQFLAYFGVNELLFVPYQTAKELLLKKLSKAS